MSDDIRALKRALQALARDGGKVAAAGVAKGLEPLAARVEADAPVDTGHLQHSVSTRTPPPRNGHARGEVVVATPYAAAVDFGTREIEADDFMQRAFDEESRRAADLAEAEIVRAIQAAI